MSNKHPFGIAQLAVAYLAEFHFLGPSGVNSSSIDLGVVDRIEKVLQVVKDHLVRFLRETAGCEQ